jgi:hypothetical protein
MLVGITLSDEVCVASDAVKFPLLAQAFDHTERRLGAGAY